MIQEPLMKALHAQLDDWLEENTGPWDGPDGPALTRQLFRVLSWYDITCGGTLERMNRKNIKSVEVMALKAIFEILHDYGVTNGF